MKGIVCCLLACITLLMGELSAQTSYPELKEIYEKSGDALSMEGYIQMLKEMDSVAADWVCKIADGRERSVATLLWHTYQRENIFRFWKAKGGRLVDLQKLRLCQLSSDPDVPEMELLSEADLNYVLDWYFYVNKYPETYWRIKECLYGIKSEKVRNLYALGLLERELRAHGIGEDMDSVFEAFRCCSKTPETVNRVNELERMYMPVRQDVIPLDIVLPDNEGNMFRLRDLRERNVFICVWSLDSVKGANELDVFAGARRVKNNWNENGIVYVNIAVGMGSDQERWREILKNRRQTEWMVNLFCDRSQHSFPKDYVIETLPRYIFINPDGYLRSAWFVSPGNMHFKDVFRE